VAREDLIPVKRAVTRMGTSYEQTYWVRARELRETFEKSGATAALNRALGSTTGEGSEQWSTRYRQRLLDKLVEAGFSAEVVATWPQSRREQTLTPTELASTKDALSKEMLSEASSGTKTAKTMLDDWVSSPGEERTAKLRSLATTIAFEDLDGEEWDKAVQQERDLLAENATHHYDKHYMSSSIAEYRGQFKREAYADMRDEVMKTLADESVSEDEDVAENAKEIFELRRSTSPELRKQANDMINERVSYELETQGKTEDAKLKADEAAEADRDEYVKRVDNEFMRYTDEDIEAVYALAAVSQSLYDEDTVTLYRGIKGEYAKDIREAAIDAVAKSGALDQAELFPKDTPLPVAYEENLVKVETGVMCSFSEDVNKARGFTGDDGVVMKMTVPKSSILASYRLGSEVMHQGEKEVIVLTKGEFQINPNDIEDAKAKDSASPFQPMFEEGHWRQIARGRGQDLSGPLPPREEEYQESEGEWAP